MDFSYNTYLAHILLTLLSCVVPLLINVDSYVQLEVYSSDRDILLAYVFSKTNTKNVNINNRSKSLKIVIGEDMCFSNRVSCLLCASTRNLLIQISTS